MHPPTQRTTLQARGAQRECDVAPAHAGRFLLLTERLPYPASECCCTRPRRANSALHKHPAHAVSTPHPPAQGPTKTPA